jgi:AraC-like DNA-binding protein
MLSTMKHAVSDAFIAKIRKLLDENPEHPPTLRELGESVGVSPYYLQRVFKQATGQSPKQYLKSKQLQTLKTQLQNGTDVTTALYEAGYSSPSRLYEKANAYLGMTPALYKKGGPGLTIEYASITCELGVILVAQTPKGVCAVRIGDNEEMLLRDLQREFSRRALFIMASILRRDYSRCSPYLAEKSSRPLSRWILSLPRFNTKFGRRCAKSQWARRAHTDRSRRKLGNPARLALWAAPAGRTPWPSLYPVIVLCEKINRWAGIVGA